MENDVIYSNSVIDAEIPACITPAQYEAQQKQLAETLEKLRRYEEVTSEIEEEFTEMQNSLTRERMMSSKAMSIATKVYQQNKALKTRTSRLSQRSSRHQKWAEQSSIDTLTVPGESDDIGHLNDENLTADIISNEIEALKTEKSIELELQDARNEISTLQFKCKDISDKLGSVLKENEELNETIRMHQEAETAAADEIETLTEKLDVESHVRKRAETLAAKMYGENKSWKKQSIMRTKSGETDDNSEGTELQDAMDEIKSLSEKLEEEKVISQQKIEELQEIIDSYQDQSEVDALKRSEEDLTSKLKDVKEERDELERKCKTQEKELEDLRTKPRYLRPAPPPPNVPAPPPMAPPLPPPMPHGTSKRMDPLSKLKQLINQRKLAAVAIGGNKVISAERKQTTQGLLVYDDAMEEMMQRIKKGNVGLKKVRRFTDIPEDGECTETEKYATLGPSCGRSATVDDTDEDVFMGFRRGLKSPGTNTLGPSTRKSSAPPSLLSVDFKKNLKQTGTTEGEESDEICPNGISEKRQFKYQQSVKHPKGISPELQKILDATRAKAKLQKSEALASDDSTS